MRKFVLFLALGASGFAVAATAQTPPPLTPPPAPMRTDLSRSVTRADYIAQADARFMQMDADHDGAVSRSEMMAYREAMRDRRIADGGTPPPPPPPPPVDKAAPATARDGERTITRQDFTDRAAKRFDRMDTNHDGILDQAERAAGRPIRGGRGMGGMGGMHDGQMPPPPGPDAD